ncbi:MAG: AAA family ATPase [Deltaproteobacteria bacterium]|nr:AAA family ATPase [Deltaproteobacteria bacterium]
MARRTIVIYGKGGVGKSTVASHLADCFAGGGRRVLLVGCDPKTDSSLRLLGPKRPRTVVESIADRSLDWTDLRMRSDSGVDVVETGGALPGSGCAGQGVAAMVRMLRRNPAALDDYDVVLFDVLGDLVCGGFVAPMDLGQGSHVFIVSSEEPASLFAANNVVRALAQPLWHHVPAGGIVFNVRGRFRSGVLREFAARLGLPVVAILRRSATVAAAERVFSTAIRFAPDSSAARDFRKLARAVEAATDARGAAPLTPMDLDEFREFVIRSRAG